MMNKLIDLIDNHNKPFKHLRIQYDADLIAEVKQELQEQFGKDVDVNQITINKNNRLGKHKHLNQTEVSYGFITGTFKGGSLVTPTDTITTQNKWFIFDGTQEHYVEEFTGERYSIIAYKRK